MKLGVIRAATCSITVEKLYYVPAPRKAAATEHSPKPITPLERPAPPGMSSSEAERRIDATSTASSSQQPQQRSPMAKHAAKLLHRRLKVGRRARALRMHSGCYVS